MPETTNMTLIEGHRAAKAATEPITVYRDEHMVAVEVWGRKVVLTPEEAVTLSGLMVESAKEISDERGQRQ